MIIEVKFFFFLDTDLVHKQAGDRNRVVTEKEQLWRPEMQGIVSAIVVLVLQYLCFVAGCISLLPERRLS